MKDKAVIVGSGGHAKVVIDILRSSRTYDLIGLTDTDPNIKTTMGLPILGNDSILPQLHAEGIKYCFVAIGDNKRREEISDYVKGMGFDLINAISPYSWKSTSVDLGEGIAIMPGAVINAESVIDDNAIINTGATVDHDCVIGSSSHVAPGCSIAGNVHVGRGEFLGIGCKVIPKMTIGEWTTVGAGSVVVEDLPGHSIAFGVPARIIKNL
jgi:UDP-perosamine 4-acetyltransferase